MSTVYTGNPNNVSNSALQGVTGASSTTPIVISTAPTPHGFATGDTVQISGVGGNTAANGTFTISVNDATHFSLNGTAWSSGAYTGGGFATDLSLTPSFTIPSDGDAANAASVNVGLQACADRDQFLNQLIGKFFPAYYIAAAGALTGTSLGSNLSVGSPTQTVSLLSTTMHHGDFVLCGLSSSGMVNAASANTLATLVLKQNINSGGFVSMQGAQANIAWTPVAATPATQIETPFTVFGAITSTPAAGTLAISVTATLSGSGSDGFLWSNPYTFWYVILRLPGN